MKKKGILPLSAQVKHADDLPMIPLRMLITDDHAVIRTGLKYLIARYFPEVTLGEADACSTLKEELQKGNYTHLVLDMQLGDCNSMDLIPGMIAQHPSLRIMIYTMSPEAIYGKRLVQMGVHGFLSKEEEEDTLIQALTLFLQGQPYLSDELKRALGTEQKRSQSSINPFDDLSERELMVLCFLLQGHRVKEISNRLDLKMSTVATYKVRIFEKLNVNNLADMQRLADVYHLG